MRPYEPYAGQGCNVLIHAHFSTFTQMTYTGTDKLIIALTWFYLVAFSLLSMTGWATPLMFLITILVLVNINFKMEIFTFHLITMQFCLFCYISAFWAMNGRLSIAVGSAIFQTLISLWIFYAYYQKLPDVRILFKITMWSGYFVVMYTYFFYGVSDIVSSEETDRLNTEFLNVNVLGTMAALSMVMHFYFFLFEKKSADILMMIPAVFIIGATQSRKALISVILGILILYTLKQYRKNRNNLLPFIKIILFFIFFIALMFFLSKTGMFAGMTSRMEGLIASITGEGDADSSAIVRKFYRQIGWIQFSRTPLAGIGIANAPILTNIAMGKSAYLHCNYAEMAADGGVLGLISYYIMFLYVLFKEIKFSKFDNSAVLVITLIIIRLISDWGSVSYYNKLTYFYLMIYYLHLNTMRKRYPQIK